MFVRSRGGSSGSRLATRSARGRGSRSRWSSSGGIRCHRRPVPANLGPRNRTNLRDTVDLCGQATLGTSRTRIVICAGERLACETVVEGLCFSVPVHLGGVVLAGVVVGSGAVNEELVFLRMVGYDSMADGPKPTTM